MTEWLMEAKIIENSADALLIGDVPDHDLLNILNSLERSLKTLHQMKNAMWQRVLFLSSKGSYEWKEKPDDENNDGDHG